MCPQALKYLSKFKRLLTYIVYLNPLSILDRWDQIGRIACNHWLRIWWNGMELLLCWCQHFPMTSVLQNFAKLVKPEASMYLSYLKNSDFIFAANYSYKGALVILIYSNDIWWVHRKGIKAKIGFQVGIFRKIENIGNFLLKVYFLIFNEFKYANTLCAQIS